MDNPPFAYFITFTVFGSWLHGDGRGSVDRKHNAAGSERLESDPVRLAHEQRRAASPLAPRLSDTMRVVVAAAIEEACAHRSWQVLALNVRSNHVHLIASALDAPPEEVMRVAKMRATKALRAAGLIGHEQRVWTRHGSTRYLWHEDDLPGAWNYVVHGQEKDSADQEA